MSQINMMDDKVLYILFVDALNAPDNVVFKEELNNVKGKSFNWRAISLKDGAELLRLEQRDNGKEGWPAAESVMLFRFYAMGWLVHKGIVVDVRNKSGVIEQRTSLPENMIKVIQMFKNNAKKEVDPERLIGLTLLQQRLKQR